MKKPILILMTAAALISGAAAAAAVMGADSPADTGAPVNAAADAPEDTPAPFTVREYDGVVAVFADGFNGAPAFQTDVSVRGLREYDRALLERGIEVGSYDELLTLLEDFSN